MKKLENKNYKHFNQMKYPALIKKYTRTLVSIKKDIAKRNILLVRA